MLQSKCLERDASDGVVFALAQLCETIPNSSEARYAAADACGSCGHSDMDHRAISENIDRRDACLFQQNQADGGNGANLGQGMDNAGEAGER